MRNDLERLSALYRPHLPTARRRIASIVTTFDSNTPAGVFAAIRYAVAPLSGL
jgi:hypothetical protein